MTAYWAKDRYSTRTSSPRFSSFRNSLTHLCSKTETGKTETDRQMSNATLLRQWFDVYWDSWWDRYPMWLVRSEISSSLRVWVDSWTRLRNFYRTTIYRETVGQWFGAVEWLGGRSNAWTVGQLPFVWPVGPGTLWVSGCMYVEDSSPETSPTSPENTIDGFL